MYMSMLVTYSRAHAHNKRSRIYLLQVFDTSPKSYFQPLSFSKFVTHVPFYKEFRVNLERFSFPYFFCLIIDGPIMPTFIYQMTIYSRQSPPTTLYWLTVTPTPFFIDSRLKPPFHPRAFILYSKPLFIMSTMAEYSSSYINMPNNTFFTIACFITQEHFKEIIIKDQQDLYKSLHN